MKKFVFFICGLVLVFDSIYLSSIGSIYYIALLAPAFLVLWYGWMIKDTSLNMYADEGLFMGDALDIENPEQPKKILLYLAKSALNLGFLFLGGPGSGKTIGVISLLQYFTQKAKHGWLYCEGKGDKDIYQKCVACGAAPDKFFSSELPNSDTTNIASGEADDVIEMLTKTLVKTDNEFYRNEQREALEVAVNLLKSLNEPINLRDIYITLRIYDAAKYVIDKAKEKGVQRDIIEMAQQYFDQDPDKRMEYTKGLLTNMGRFATGAIAERLNDYNATLDLTKAAKNNMKVYLHLPLTEVAKDVATMFTEQLGVIAKNRQLYSDERTPWPAVFDDWGAFFYDGFGPITARCRSAGIPCNFSFQSKGQTDKAEIGNVFTTEIFDNIGGMVALKINGIFTAKLLSEQFGTYETTEVSINSRFTGENINIVEKPRVRADVFKNLSSGECYIDTIVTGEGGASQNRRFKARFPYPDFTGSEDIDWPRCEREGESSITGLNLWDMFMNRDREEELKLAVSEEIKNQEAARNAKMAELEDVSDAVDYL